MKYRTIHLECVRLLIPHSLFHRPSQHSFAIPFYRTDVRFVNVAFVTLDSATLLYTYISRFSVTHHHQQREKILQSCYHKFYLPTAFHSAFQLLAQTPHVRFHGQKWVHARLCSKDRTQAFTGRNMGHFGWGWYHYPRTVSCVLEPLRGQGVKRRTLPL